MGKVLSTSACKQASSWRKATEADFFSQEQGAANTAVRIEKGGLGALAACHDAGNDKAQHSSSTLATMTSKDSGDEDMCVDKSGPWTVDFSPDSSKAGESSGGPDQDPTRVYHGGCTPEDAASVASFLSATSKHKSMEDLGEGRELKRGSSSHASEYASCRKDTEPESESEACPLQEIDLEDEDDDDIDNIASIDVVGTENDEQAQQEEDDKEVADVEEEEKEKEKEKEEVAASDDPGISIRRIEAVVDTTIEMIPRLEADTGNHVTAPVGEDANEVFPIDALPENHSASAAMQMLLALERSQDAMHRPLQDFLVQYAASQGMSLSAGAGAFVNSLFTSREWRRPSLATAYQRFALEEGVLADAARVLPSPRNLELHKVRRWHLHSIVPSKFNIVDVKGIMQAETINLTWDGWSAHGGLIVDLPHQLKFGNPDPHMHDWRVWKRIACVVTVTSAFGHKRHVSYVGHYLIDNGKMYDLRPHANECWWMQGLSSPSEPVRRQDEFDRRAFKEEERSKLLYEGVAQVVYGLGCDL